MNTAVRAAEVDRLLTGARLVVCVGPGGVGKTTLAAAMGVRAAKLGRRTLVLTIDPARRLADALGLSGQLGDSARRVSLDAIAATGTLDAAMLEASASYDALIARIAETEEERARILDNRVYRAFSRTLARSHAYVAMERVFHLLEGPAAPELLILDTPPTRSALDILDAPGALTRFADGRVVDALTGTGAAVGASAYAAGKLFGLLAGPTLGDELSTFLRAFVGLRRGFSERARHVQRVLREEARFLLVAAPEPRHLDDAGHLVEGLRERGIALAATLANRAFTEDPRRPLEPLGPPSTIALDAVAHQIGSGALPVLERARGWRRDVDAHDEACRVAMAPLADAAPMLWFPRAEGEPTDVSALLALAEAGRAR